ncbi:MAG: PRC and DUF2382 domain-containing protein [Armatimonadota bacterium]
MSYTDTRQRDFGHGQIPTDLDRLENLDDFEIAEDEIDPRGWDVVGQDGEKIGTIKHLLASPTTMRAHFAVVDCGGWFNQKLFAIPLDDLRFDRNDDQVHAPFTREQFQNAPEWSEDRPDYQGYYSYWSGLGAGTMATRRDVRERGELREETGARGGEIRVPVTEEVAEVRKQAHEAGAVTIRKRAHTETQHISEPVRRTRVVAETREVPPGEQYTAANATTLREGETLRVPVIEEELTVEKTPRVTKEVVLRTETETEQVERDVELRHEEVELEEEGDVEYDEAAPRAGGRF